MKKTLLLSVVASSMIMAGGDIAPVEPAAEAPAVETSPWSISGDVKLYYSSTDSDTVDLFSKDSAIGQAAISTDVAYAINNNWKINAGLTGLATLGLDDSVVHNVWLFAGADATGGALAPIGSSVGDALWIDTLNVTGTMMDGALTVVLGRQMLDTPLAFSETWNIAPNTFDAAVALVKPTKNVTLVAGYIYDGNGNGERIGTFENPEGGFTHDDGYMPAITDNGAWTVAAIATMGDVTGQVWYYDVMDIADAVWVQADTNINGFALGAQYAWIGPKDVLEGAEDSSAWAVKAGYKMDALNVWAAYSSVDSDGVIPVANTATMASGLFVLGAAHHSQSKLYTEAWWNYGYVSQPGADTIAVAADYTVGNYNLGVQYTAVSDAENKLDGTPAGDLDELTLLAGTKVMGVDVQLAYIYADKNAGDENTVQAYFTYNF